MELNRLTEPAASQLAFLRSLREEDIPPKPDPEPALEPAGRRRFLASPVARVLFSVDFLLIFLNLGRRINSLTATRTILGFCNLFSCCKDVRRFSGILISWARDLSLPNGFKDRKLFDWGRMENCTVGEHLCLAKISAPLARVPLLKFRQEDSRVSTCRALDIDNLRDENGDRIRIVRPPLNRISRAVIGLFRRFQADGNLYVLAKLGFFSLPANRSHGIRILESIITHAEYYQGVVGNEYEGLVGNERFTTLLSLLQTSYGIMDLHPEIVGVDMEEVFPYATLLTGFHPGLDCGKLVFTPNVSLGVVHLLRNE